MATNQNIAIAQAIWSIPNAGIGRVIAIIIAMTPIILTWLDAMIRN